MGSIGKLQLLFIHCPSRRVYGLYSFDREKIDTSKGSLSKTHVGNALPIIVLARWQSSED
jgi:hypothetical protein